MAAYRRVNDLGHLQADCLYTGISSGTNARCRVWEALTFTFLSFVAECQISMLVHVPDFIKAENWLPSS